ncbi:hypothetical protein T07_13444 [Trichinella nelsoni]|uniref:Uncharacterized protein n=1 Tax=Trichinella nelsoni TaxID=6336 RepID=A0A0V0S495_9BILA|nr:hypothetical protein T07_13444 [Trichinella nelsoni]
MKIYAMQNAQLNEQTNTLLEHSEGSIIIYDLLILHEDWPKLKMLLLTCRLAMLMDVVFIES